MACLAIGSVEHGRRFDRMFKLGFHKPWHELPEVAIEDMDAPLPAPCVLVQDAQALECPDLGVGRQGSKLLYW